MQDRELYRQLLGLREPWAVTEVKIDFEGLRADVWVEWPPEQQGVCPECGKACRINDHREERQWRHLDNILTYLKHRITNAVAEGLNSKIQQVKSAARGFRKFENYRIAILFFCGKLDMYPQKSR
jgi:transposase